ncbi:MAG: methylmalonyl Co-A mutase-associated GTPase MeaB, partial [Pseudomonadota bacterium]
TVGVGQSETQIADMADYVAFCAQPGSGDALQFMKAGVMEIPDLVLVTKGDLGPLARRTMTDLKGALSLTSPGGTVPEVLLVSAQTGEGLEAVVSWIAGRKGGDTAQRQTQAELWATGQMRERFGLAGLEMLQRSENRLNLTQPFTSAAICTHWLTTRVFSEIRAD